MEPTIIRENHEDDLRKLLVQVCKRNPAYLNRLKGLVSNMVRQLPASQWCGHNEWADDEIEEVYHMVLEKLFQGNLIRFWVSARTDSCTIRVNLHDLVFNIVYDKAPKTGKLFHTHVANQLCDDPQFVKKCFGRKNSKGSVCKIGLAEWQHVQPSFLAGRELIGLWKQKVTLPSFKSAYKIKPAQRQEIFRQMLELAQGWVESADFYHGYAAITGFSFKTELFMSGLDAADEEGAGAYLFDRAVVEARYVDVDIREKARLAKVESYDSWRPHIQGILNESPEKMIFLRKFFVDRLGAGEAALAVGKTPTWATKTTQSFYKSVAGCFDLTSTVKEADKIAFVQLIIEELATYNSGGPRP